MPYDWEGEAWPASAEVQAGYKVKKGIAVYTDHMLEIGSDCTYDQRIGFGLRFNY